MGQGVLAALGPSYEVRDIRWRSPEVARGRLWFDPASRRERFEGHFMLRPEYHARDANLLAKLFSA